tara:strand:- start:404 stop:532 length:129 start_codon:yes stop_codon:yes gene_type:complete
MLYLRRSRENGNNTVLTKLSLIVVGGTDLNDEAAIGDEGELI